MNERSPIIAFDRNLGKHLDYIDVDYDRLVDYMSERGFDDNTISQTKINISAEPKHEYHKGSKETYYTLGMYSAKKDQINLYPADMLDGHNSAAEAVPTVRSMLDESITSRVNESLAHELEHKLVRQEGGMPDERQYDRKNMLRQFGVVATSALALQYGYEYVAEQFGVDTSGAFATVAIAALAVGSSMGVPKFIEKYVPGARQRAFDRYESSPEEARCRKAGKNCEPIIGITTYSRSAELPDAA